MSIRYEQFTVLPDIYHDDIVRLLVMTDKEFVPPLSARSDTTQTDFHAMAAAQGEKCSISLYFKALLRQGFILAIADDKVVGFLSYIKDYVILNEIEVPEKNAYVSTICVDPGYRRRGITNHFYELLEANPDNQLVYTRTWSQNDSHLGLLRRRNYECILEVADDRASGISTVYYAKRLGGFIK